MTEAETLALSNSDFLDWVMTYTSGGTVARVFTYAQHDRLAKLGGYIAIGGARRLLGNSAATAVNRARSRILRQATERLTA
jgi:hypothetical protein